MLVAIFITLLLGGIGMQIINGNILPSWMGYVVGLELFIVSCIVSDTIIKWVAKILDIKQHEL